MPYKCKITKNKNWHEWYAINKEEWLAKGRARAREYKQKAFDLLGNKCTKCGIVDSRVLQVDHINGGGTKEKREKGHGSCLMYLRVIKNPELYQLLCTNCNWIKRIESKEARHIILERAA